MNSETIVMCVVALILGMLMANMLKSVCGCRDVVEGLDLTATEKYNWKKGQNDKCKKNGTNCSSGYPISLIFYENKNNLVDVKSFLKGPGKDLISMKQFCNGNIGDYNLTDGVEFNCEV